MHGAPRWKPLDEIKLRESERTARFATYRAK
jgi:hypothetical protein